METTARSRLAAAAIVLTFATIAVIRLLTQARDPWEWDEVLLLNAVERGIDIRINQPHPPGYPVFVEAGRLLTAAGAASFDAATLVGTLGGILSVFGVFCLGKKIGLTTAFALFAALFYAFLPSVWLHGVRPLSDPPATAAFLFAAAVLVDTVRTPRASRLALAALLTAIVFGLRAQAGLGLLPLALLAAIRVVRAPRGARAVAVAAAAGLLLTIVIWLPAVHGSGGIGPFFERLAEAGRYVQEVDRARAADLARSLFWKRWFRDPFADSGLAYTFLIVAGAAIALRGRRALEVMGLFLPVAVLSVLFLGSHSAPRYALVVLPAPCLLVALSLDRLSQWRHQLSVAVGGGFVFWLGWVALPPVLEVHRRPSPSVAAMAALKEDPALSGRPLFFDGHLEVHVPRFLPGRAATLIPDAGLPPMPPGALVVATDGNTFGLKDPIRTFAFESRALSRISRGRYLSVRIYEAGGAEAPPPR